MSRLAEAWRAWVALWDRREPPTALALVRIAVGTVVLVDLLQAWWLGLVTAIWAPPPDGLAYGPGASASTPYAERPRLRCSTPTNEALK